MTVVDAASNCSVFAIKAEVTEPGAEAFAFSEQKTMYGCNRIIRGDETNEQDRGHLGGSGGVPAAFSTAGNTRCWRCRRAAGPAYGDDLKGRST